MPQASEKDRAWARKKFGSIDTSGPEKFLTDAGYKLTRDWRWKFPPGKTQETMTRDEVRAVLFLMHEWDYGGLWIKL